MRSALGELVCSLGLRERVETELFKYDLVTYVFLVHVHAFINIQSAGPLAVCVMPFSGYDCFDSYTQETRKWR